MRRAGKDSANSLPPGQASAALQDPAAASWEIATSAQRKAGLRLIPVIGVGYGLAYMDRVNISFASPQMNRDLRFSSTMYGLGAGWPAQGFDVDYALATAGRMSSTSTHWVG